MAIRIIVNGANGRMGQETVKTVQQTKSFDLVAQVNRGDNLAAIIKDTQAAVVIDFSNAAAVFENTTTIIQAGAHPVMGATGLTPQQIVEFQQTCANKKLGGIIVPNFSISAVLMMKFARETAKYLPNVEIIEMHHPGKLDSPSGTAIKTAEMIAEVKASQTSPLQIHETIPSSRGADCHGVPIHAVRLPGFVADQQVIFGNQGETFTLQHRTINREAFMPGVKLACEKVMDLQELVYGLEHIL